MSQEELSEINTVLDTLQNYPIFVVDNTGTRLEIKDTIIHYINQNKLIERKKVLVVTLDHTLLVKTIEGEGEKETIDGLYHTLVALKPYISALGGKILFFVLSQLNRNIETTERIKDPRLHYPNKNDLFGASSVYHSSDYVLVVHRPCLIEGLGNWYGPRRQNWDSGLPVFSPDDPRVPMIYLHAIKERFGSNRIIAMLDDLKHSKIIEYNF